MPDGPDPDPERLSDELVEVRCRREKEARDAGLTIVEARLFSESDADIGEFRKLVSMGCPVKLLRKIVL